MHQGTEHHPYRGRLRYDPTFFLELKFCNENGLPHSAFLSWDPSDRAKALAFEMEKATRCVMCGSADWEWDPEQGGSRDAYEVIERFCWGCYKKSYMQDSIERRDGVTLELAPTGTVEAARRQVALERAYESGLL